MILYGEGRKKHTKTLKEMCRKDRETGMSK